VYVNVPHVGVSLFQFGIEVLFLFIFFSVMSVHIYYTTHLLLERGCVIISHTVRYFNNGRLLHYILNIQSDSKLSPWFPRSLNGNPDNNLESFCIFLVFISWWEVQIYLDRTFLPG
jgi:hypothetical protein